MVSEQMRQIQLNCMQKKTKTPYLLDTRHVDKRPLAGAVGAPKRALPPPELAAELEEPKREVALLAFPGPRRIFSALSQVVVWSQWLGAWRLGG